jgi:hypothetical protein
MKFQHASRPKPPINLGMWRILCIAGLAMAPRVFGASAAVVTLGEEHCHTVRMPASSRVFDYDQLDLFRQRAGTAFGKPGREQPPREREPAAAPVAAVVAQHLEPGGIEPRIGDEYVFRQRPFRRSGPKWPVTGDEVRISPNEKWIAVQSWEGTDYRDEETLLPAAPPLDLTARFFIDVYDVSSGERVISLDGVDHDFTTGDAPLHFTFWMDSHFFVVPLGTFREKLLVCETPETIPDVSTR